MEIHVNITTGHGFVSCTGTSPHGHHEISAAIETWVDGYSAIVWVGNTRVFNFIVDSYDYPYHPEMAPNIHLELTPESLIGLLEYTICGSQHTVVCDSIVHN